MTPPNNTQNLYHACQLLETEISEYTKRFPPKAKKVEITFFHSLVKSELEHLKNAKQSSISSNYSFLKAVWTQAQLVPNVVALATRFHFKHDNIKNQVQVDIIGNNGFLWVKLCNQTKRSLEFETASILDDDQIEQFSIVRTAKRLLLAAQTFKIQNVQPRVVLVVPKLSRGTRFIDEILDYVSNLGVTIHLSDKTPFPNEFPASQTLNLDVTTLIALASDISNTNPINANFSKIHPALSSQIKHELSNPVLKDDFFHIFCNRKLTCPESAFRKFMEILEELGSLTEKERGQILFSSSVCEFQKLTIHNVPLDMQLPIQTTQPQYSQVVHEYEEKLSLVAKDVILVGWTNNWTTITANALVYKILGKLPPRDKPIYLAVHIHHGRSLLKHLGEY